MKYRFFLFCFLLFSSACNQKRQETKISNDVITEESNWDDLRELKHSSYESNKSILKKILISSLPDLKDTTVKYTSLTPRNVFQVTEIQKFENLLKKGRRTGYCCCPNESFTIQFFSNNQKVDNYYADTIESKDTVRIYDKGFQFSYLVNKNEWEKFLKESSHLDFYEFSSSNLLKGRKIYKYAAQNNFITETSDAVSKYWMLFDGFFYVKMTLSGKEINAKRIVYNMKKKYPAMTFKAEVLNRKQSYSEDKKTFYEGKILMKIYCNENFYNSFKKANHNKSTFQKTATEFCVFSTKTEIDVLRKKFK